MLGRLKMTRRMEPALGTDVRGWLANLAEYAIPTMISAAGYLFLAICWLWTAARASPIARLFGPISSALKPAPPNICYSGAEAPPSEPPREYGFGPINAQVEEAVALQHRGQIIDALPSSAPDLRESPAGLGCG